MIEKHFAWFALGWLTVCFVSWTVEKMRGWLRKQIPCPSCEGTGYQKVTVD